VSAAAKFTPGPWTAADRVVVTTIESNGFATWLANCAVGGSGCDQQLANAHLIAAAPELYEALRSVLDALGALSNPSELYARLGNDDACKRVWDALAKAEGASP
jgi:hypothetical protein